MTKKSIPMLLDEPPITVYPSLAKKLGNVNKAIILQQLHFLLNITQIADNQYNLIDDKWWVYNSYEQWHKYFSWLSVSTIKGLFGVLEHDGLILSRQGVKDKWDRRKWYTIDYDEFNNLVQCKGQKLSDVHGTKTVPSEGQKLSDESSEITSEITSDTFAPKVAKRKAEPFYDAIASVFNLTASGQIVCIRAMLQGNAKRGTWKDCNFEPAVIDPQEIIDFGAYMAQRKREKNISEPITAAVTIQRWFYDYREMQKKATQPRSWADIPELRGIKEIIR